MKLGEGRDAAHRFQVKITVKMLVYVVYYPLQPGMVVLKYRLHRPSMAVPSSRPLKKSLASGMVM
jgi:hypothetical protein